MKWAFDEYGGVIIEVLAGCVILAGIMAVSGLSGTSENTLKTIAEGMAQVLCP